MKGANLRYVWNVLIVKEAVEGEVPNPMIYEMNGYVGKTRRLGIKEPFSAICELFFRESLFTAQLHPETRA
jgi:hypothetical protein